MTRKSKRELEKAIEDLDAQAEGSNDRETFADRHYSEDVKEFVYGVARSVMSLSHDPEIANLDEPDQTHRHLEALRDAYGIEEDLDDEVLETLTERVARVENPHWGPQGVLPGVMVCGPALLDEADRERFDGLRAAGDDEAAEQLLVGTVYRWLADGGGLKREVPA